MSNILYDIAFSIDQSLTSIEKAYLFKQLGSSKKVLNLSKSSLKNFLQRGWTGNRWNPQKFIEDAKKMFEFMGKAGIKTVRWNEKDFPKGLKQIPDLPFLLYYRGNIEFNLNESIAVIGTRKPNTAGVKRTEIYTKYLTKKRFTIVSGLAEGIDGFSHYHCLLNKGKTIAVLGCGIDRTYPAVNQKLARMILDNDGALISEYPPGFAPKKWYFPRRNRIIVGMCRSVLIIQSPGKSGSLISANLAADYNRELFVVSPGDGDIDAGNKQLIMSGAQEVNTPKELLEQFAY